MLTAEFMSVTFEGCSIRVFRTERGFETVADILEHSRAFLITFPKGGKYGDRQVLISLDWANRIEVKGAFDGEHVLIPLPVMRRESVHKCFPDHCPVSFREIVVSIFACD